MPEGDTIRWAANRIIPVLEGRVPDEILTPHPRFGLSRWPERLAGRAVTRVDTHGKHLFLRFEGDLTLHSHLRMTGSWGVYRDGQRRRRSPSRAWIILRSGSQQVVEFDGPVLELLTEARIRFDQRLAALGPDVLADQLDSRRFIARLRAGDQTRAVGEALLDQSTIAGIGNMWKAEACWEAGLDPWRTLGEASDHEVLAAVELVRPRMLRSAQLGPRAIEAFVYHHGGRPCPRCGTLIRARGQGEDNRTTFWCPGCQH